VRFATIRGVILLCLVCLLACSGGSTERAEGRSGYRDRGTLIVGRASDALSLDPARITDSESIEVCEQVYESLLRYHPGTSDLEPGLAESWTVSSDGRQWDFKLRRGVRFHDGTPFNAAAVVFSFKRQFDPNHEHHYKDATPYGFAWGNTFKNIVEVEELSEFEVRITIERKFAPFAANLAMTPVSIVSPTAVATWREEFYRHPVGTGPFRFVEWSDGRIVLDRNDQYWRERAKLERLVFRAIPDGRQRLVALESEAIDVAYSILPDETQFVRLHPHLELYTAAANNVAYVALNTQKPPLDDVRVRRALNHAVHKEPMVQLAYQGMAIPANGPLPPGQWGFRPDVFGYPYSAERGRALLQEALIDGTFDPTVELQLYVPSTPRAYLPNPSMVGRMLRAQFESIGLKVRIVEQGLADHLRSLRRGEHDLGVLGWVGDNGDPDNFLHTLLDRDNTALGTARNLAFFRDDTVHELLIEAQRTNVRSQREALYARVQDRVGDLAPWIPLAHSQVSVAVRGDVRGIVLSHTAHVIFSGVSRL
jgi:peptide/nickel transport system substrate-binding protein